MGGGCLFLSTVEEKGPRAKPAKLRGGLRDSLTGSET